MESRNNQLIHYGVLGMKWGVRKNPSKAYARAAKKKNRLETESAKTGLKGAKLQVKATKLTTRAITDRQMKKAMKFQLKANKLNLQSEKLRSKGLKWTAQMDKVFKDYKVERNSDGSYSVTKINDE